MEEYEFVNEDFEEVLSSDEEKILIEDYKEAMDKVAAAEEKFDPNQPWIQTYSGERFTPLDPRLNQINIVDIAHSLSRLCRFTGHTDEFYSVAQHSVLVSYICDEEDALWGLLHDASEAYITDISTPLKHSGKFNDYIEIEKNLMSMICKKFNLPEEQPKSTKTADNLLLATEARDLLKNLRKDWRIKTKPLPFKIIPILPNEAKTLFLERFHELTNKGE